MKKVIMLGILFLALQSGVAAAPPDCHISERIILENTGDEVQTFTFQRGTHEGFVSVLPSQSVTVDLVRCK